jgi:hypothetical protein
VISVCGSAIRLDEGVVHLQARCPVVLLSIDESEVPLEAQAERPSEEGPRGVPFVEWGEVPLPDGHRAVSSVS